MEWLRRELMNLPWEYVLFGTGFGLILFMGQLFIIHFIKVILWLKEGIEDADGKLNLRDIVVVTCTSLFAFMVISDGFFDFEFNHWAWALTGSGMGVEIVEKIAHLIKQK